MKSYQLENLSCAHCANTIEQTLADLDRVSHVRLRFSTLQLDLDTTDFARVKRTIESIEPEVRVVEPQDSPPTSDSSLWKKWMENTVGGVALGALLVAQAMGWNGAGGSPWRAMH